ncbi:MerR family transcriptional regulator [Oceaniglobus indicus]|uniref:MerR family transcriptional regulator n=1 Tax=Oceaniglobus indicus TaxID=2047749 RepID=UPI001F4E3898|nr:MerR family transcriptional regulator [Oceaniglobus indicus]
MTKSPDAFRTISEVAEWLDVPTHVLRFWESRFTQIKPVKRAGGRRYYRPSDMELLGGIKKLLHEDGLTIRGVQKILREEGPKHVAAQSPSIDARGSDDAEGPMAVDVPPLPPKGEVVQFAPERAAPAEDPPADPDDALSRWPFANDADDADQVADPTPPEHSAASEDKAPPPIDDSADKDEPSAEPEPQPADTAPSEADTAPARAVVAVPDDARGLAAYIAALPAERLTNRAPDLIPLVGRMEQLRAQLTDRIGAETG